MNKIFFFTVWCIFLIPMTGLTREIVLPPINLHERVNVIVTLKNPEMYEESVEKAASFPGITVRREFKQVLRGFSIEGERHNIEALK